MDFGGDVCEVDDDDILLELIPSASEVREALLCCLFVIFRML